MMIPASNVLNKWMLNICIIEQMGRGGAGRGSQERELLSFAFEKNQFNKPTLAANDNFCLHEAEFLARKKPDSKEQLFWLGSTATGECLISGLPWD